MTEHEPIRPQAIVAFGDFILDLQCVGDTDLTVPIFSLDFLGGCLQPCEVLFADLY